MAEAMFRVNGVDYPVPEELNLGEVCDAEQFFGVDFTSGKTGMSAAVAMLYIAIRRVDPTVTVDDVRALPPDVFSAALEAADEDPTSGSERSEKSVSSGDASTPTSDTIEPLNGTGNPGSAIGSVSDLATLQS